MSITFKETATSCGNIYRTTITVGGKDFILEMDLDRTWVNIIDQDSRCETCIIDEDGNVIAEGGEYVTESWTDADWTNLTASVGISDGFEMQGQMCLQCAKSWDDCECKAHRHAA